MVCVCDGESGGGRGRSITLQVKPGWVSFSFLVQKKTKPIEEMEKEKGMIAINKPKNKNHHCAFVSGVCHSQPSITIDRGGGEAGETGGQTCVDIPWTSERPPHSPSFLLFPLCMTHATSALGSRYFILFSPPPLPSSLPLPWGGR